MSEAEGAGSHSSKVVGLGMPAYHKQVDKIKAVDFTEMPPAKGKSKPSSSGSGVGPGVGPVTD